MCFDYLPDTDIKLMQSKEMFRMNTDTHLLGGYIKIKRNESVLDIGTNNGALLLYASIFKPKKLIGIDINDEAIKLAKYNMTINNIDATLISGDVKNLKINQVDVIICNPPYFNETNKNINLAIKNARHESLLTLEELFRCFNSLIKDSGRIYMVHRASRIVDIMRASEMFNIRINKMQFVYDKRIKNAGAVLLELRKGKLGKIIVEEAKYL